MITSYDVLKVLLRTEKSAFLEAERKYIFEISSRANKNDVRRAVEEIYSVKVQSVNIAIARGKLKRVRHQLGKTPDWKKAIVTLQEGQKIEVT